MFDGYPTRLAVTSLALLALLAAGPAAPRSTEARGCGPIASVYAQRVRRAVRAELLLAYARAHASRANLVLETLRQHGGIEQLIQSDHSMTAPQETDNPRLNHLVHYIVAHCLRR